MNMDLDMPDPGMSKKEYYEYLLEIQNNLQTEVDELAAQLQNNKIKTFDSAMTEDEMKLKQEKYLESLVNQIKRKSPMESMGPEMLEIEVLQKLEEDIETMKELTLQAENELEEYKEENKYLKNKLSTLDEMKQAYLDSEKDLSEVDFNKELSTLKAVFVDCKGDMMRVVDTIFPNHDGFQEFMSEITKAYCKGGDDMYVKVTDENKIYVNYMVAAELATFHRNDKSIIKLQVL